MTTTPAKRLLVAFLAWVAASILIILAGALVGVTEVALPLRVGLVSLAASAYAGAALTALVGLASLYMAVTRR